MAWSRRYKEAELAMDQREVLLQNLVTEIEQKLTYIASTAIEDKLQEGVPETIAKLLRAGIKVRVFWLVMERLINIVGMGSNRR